MDKEHELWIKYVAHISEWNNDFYILIDDDKNWGKPDKQFKGIGFNWYKKMDILKFEEFYSKDNPDSILSFRYWLNRL